MTEEELIVIEGDVADGFGGTYPVADFVEEIRRLRAALKASEDLLFRAANDSEAVELGRQDERARILTAIQQLRRELAAELVNVSWGAAANFLIGLETDLKAQGCLEEPLPPERMRERIRRLEEALKPFADYGVHLDESYDPLPGGCEIQPLVKAGVDVQLPTVGDCRRATALLKEQP